MNNEQQAAMRAAMYDIEEATRNLTLAERGRERARKRVEELLNTVPSQALVTDTSSGYDTRTTRAIVDSFFRPNSAGFCGKIPLIKFIREETSLGLKESKDIVDKWEAHMRDEYGVHRRGGL